MRRTLPGFVVLLLLSAVPAAISQEQEAEDEVITDEIVVTGEFRESAVDSSPISVSVLQPEDPRRTVVQHVEQVLTWAPNVNISSGASRSRFYQIRGIGERSQFVEPLNSSVGLMIDGVDMSGIGTVATMFDVEQISAKPSRDV